MENFERYFLHEKKILLENISYETVKMDKNPGEMKLGCKDTIVAQLMEHGVKINFNREVKFDPEGIFNLSVTFGMMLIFDPTTKNEINWKGMDIAKEFQQSCPHLLTALMSRTSLMVSQITSAGGQNPIVTPAGPVMRQQ